MKEQLISFETAKLAKEKGLRYKNLYYFDLKGNGITDYYRHDYRKNSPVIARYTQSSLQKWLREEHNIVILVDTFLDSYACKISCNQTTGFIHSNTQGPHKFKTYEEALEIGLLEGLQYIK